MIEKFKKYILAGISLLLGAFLPYLYSYADTYAQNFQIIIYIASIILSVAGLLIITWIQYQNRAHRVKYSILVFAIDSQNRLLTTYNKHHRRLMIPCGIIPADLTPNETVYSFLKQQTGLNKDDYQNILFRSKKRVFKQKIYPSDTQIEFVTKHEKHVKLHYAFIYFIRVKEHAEYAPHVSFMSIEELKQLPPAEGLYSDLLARYGFLLDELKKGGSN